MAKNEVDQVVLVGGSTRIPKVRMYGKNGYACIVLVIVLCR